MPVTLTEEYICLRLTEAIEAADPLLDGYSELDLTDPRAARVDSLTTAALSSKARASCRCAPP